MSDVVIRSERLGKKYSISHQVDSARYEALRDVVMQRARGLLDRTRSLVSGKPVRRGDTTEEMWALRDVSFEIERGQAVGVIGSNGAGKSTLLKVLSRITEPSAGRVTIKGRVASLLEVGTGFHPELTGRENIFLNGAILGMSRKEMRRKFDEIVSFAEVERFLDTPVKRYSSGMYVRLAFAVAAHLEPEILVVDEVLAVGDAQFQKKCLGRMGEVAKGGRTVLFVSHNMGAVRNLCNRAIWLDNGCLLRAGETREVLREYEERVSGRSTEVSCVAERDPAGIKGSGLHFNRVEIMNCEGGYAAGFKYGEGLVLNVGLGGRFDGGVYSAEFRIYNELSVLVAVGASGPYHGKYFSGRTRRLRIEVNPLLLTSGKYRILLSLMAGCQRIDTWESAISFSITECQPFRMNWEMPAHREGVCVLQHSFEAVD
jgi:lipopolysaccharide transport system ATP-binding protein